MKKELKMPKTKFEAIVFTAITAWMVVYVMNYINITVLVKTIKWKYISSRKIMATDLGNNIAIPHGSKKKL